MSALLLPKNKGITTEDTRKKSGRLEQLPQRDQEFLNSAPPLVRTLVVESYDSKAYPITPCITRNLMILKKHVNRSNDDIYKTKKKLKSSKILEDLL